MIRFSILTVESDSADPAVMAALRELLDRAGVGPVVLAQPSGVALAPATALVEHAPMYGVRCAAEPPVVPSRGRPKGSRNRPPEAEVVPAAEPAVVETEPPPPAVRVVVEPEPEPEPEAEAEAAPAKRVMDVGRVEGFIEQARAQGSLAERIFTTVAAEPGVTIDALARQLLGKSDGAAVRRVDMLAGPMVMSGRLARYNGRLYTSMAQAAELKLGPPQRGRPSAKRDEDTHDVHKLHDKIVAAFGRDNQTPLPALATAIFGTSIGHTMGKLHLLLRQLVQTERLERVAGGYRPVKADEKRGRGLDDGDEDEDETESNGQPDEDDELEELG